jgi:hypothetical protein
MLVPTTAIQDIFRLPDKHPEAHFLNDYTNVLAATSVAVASSEQKPECFDSLCESHNTRRDGNACSVCRTVKHADRGA